MVALMISSQVLLMCFMAYWLVSQYEEEEAQLHKQLEEEYLSTYDQLLDSMLMTHLIAPTLNDSMRVRLNITENLHFTENLNSQFRHDTGASHVIVKHLNMDSLGDPEIITVRIEGEPDHDSSFLISPHSEEMLVRSVKLFISETDKSFRSDPKMGAFFLEIDSAKFKYHLNESIQRMGANFYLDWVDKNGTGPDNGNSPDNGNRLSLSGSPEQKMPVFTVSQIRGYLLRSILPQILFGLILLGLSASALLFVYRSLRKQVILNELRENFIGNISHELKTPVSTVKVALEALRTFDFKKDPKVTGEYLKMASSEMDRLEGLVEKVLQNQVLENQAMMLQKERCDLNPMVRRVIISLQPQVEKQNASISFPVTEKSFNLFVDPVYVESVILNLLDNSLKYGGPSPKISIVISRQQGGISLTVADKGPGIPPEFKNQIFDKFFRIPSGNLHNVKGYGLGLNFSALVMAQHGGSITVNNLPDLGCEFTLHFPPENA